MDLEQYSIKKEGEKIEDSLKQDTEVVVVLTTGKTDRGVRATLAFGWACTALALGKKVSIYLTMDGTVWAMQDAAQNVKVDGFENLQEYIDQFIDLGGEILVCAPCSEYYCAFPHKDKPDYRLISESKLSGLSTVVSMVSSNTSVVTF
jgi:predicted peroxiredoxin